MKFVRSFGQTNFCCRYDLCGLKRKRFICRFLSICPNYMLVVCSEALVKVEIHLFVSSSAVEMLLVSLSLLSLSSLHERHRANASSFEGAPVSIPLRSVPLLGVQVQRPAKSARFWISSQTMTGGYQTKRSASFQ